MKALNKISLMIMISLLCVSVTGGSAVAAGFKFTRNLSVGSHGDDVSLLQKFLITGGFLKIPTSTGFFGPLTMTATHLWQTSVGINPPTGYFGPISREKINTSPTTVATTSVAVLSNMNGSPVNIKIPKLGIDAGFKYTGLKSDGTMEIPNNIVDVGWYTGSPRPGEKGNAIITGHVAQIRGGVMTKPGVFNHLDELRAGDKLYVMNNKGESVTFVVREIRSYDPAADATDVFISKDSGAHLNLITCEGTWNPAQKSYSQRLVIFTDLAQ